MDCSLPGFSVHRILQARILEWVAVSFSRGISHSGMEPGAPALQADSLLSEPLGAPIGQSYQKFTSEKVITVVLSIGVPFYQLSQC